LNAGDGFSSGMHSISSLAAKYQKAEEKKYYKSTSKTKTGFSRFIEQ